MVVTNQGSPFICSMWKVAANGGASGDMAGGGGWQGFIPPSSRQDLFYI